MQEIETADSSNISEELRKSSREQVEDHNSGVTVQGEGCEYNMALAQTRLHACNAFPSGLLTTRRRTSE